MGNLGSEITKDSKVILAGQKVQNGVPIYFLKLIHTGARASSYPLLVWVQGDRWTVERMEAQTGGRREFAVQWEHQLVSGKYWLARRLVATIPSRDWSREGHHGRSGAAATGEGKVTVEFSEVRVNTGLSDTLFEEKK